MPTDNEIGLNVAVCREVLSNLEDLRGQLDRNLNSFETTAEALSSTWTGEARAEYFALKSKWDDQITKISSNIQLLGRAIETMAVNTKGADRLR